MKRIEFYETLSGYCPVAEFLDSIPSKQAQKVVWFFKLIEELPRVSTNFLKKIVNNEDIWEVRVSFAKETFRFLGFFDGKKLIILNHAFRKKSQKIPRQDIRIAIKRKNEYLQRSHRDPLKDIYSTT